MGGGECPTFVLPDKNSSRKHKLAIRFHPKQSATLWTYYVLCVSMWHWSHRNSYRVKNLTAVYHSLETF